MARRDNSRSGGVSTGSQRGKSGGDANSRTGAGARAGASAKLGSGAGAGAGAGAGSNTRGGNASDNTSIGSINISS